MTLGCGAAGGNITSDNISPLHLINLKRVAYGVRDVAPPPPGLSEAGRIPEVRSSMTSSAPKRATIEQVVDQWLGGRAGAAIAPPLSSFKELEPSQSRVVEPVEKRETKPIGFVCEDDVRSAIQGNSKITVGKKTIITPSARDLGEANDVFVLADS